MKCCSACGNEAEDILIIGNVIYPICNECYQIYLDCKKIYKNAGVITNESNTN